VIRFIYNLLWPIGLLLFLPGYLVKMFRRGGYRKKFGQRLGFYDVDLVARLKQQRPTWLHAVSVGEVGVALKLAAQMRVVQPDLRGVLTTTTTTGFSFANKNAPHWIEVMYNPLDFWPIMRRALAVIRPAQVVLIEAEIWPNLVAEAHARGIPIALANARLSPRSERRFRRFRPFVAPTFRLLDLVCVPEVEDVDRWSALGVEPNCIRHTGSIKYDPANVEIDRTMPEKVLREFKIDNPEMIGAPEAFRSRPIIFGGSTHAGEEEILGQIFVELRAESQNLFLVIAPRHAERARDVEGVLEQLGLRVALRSQSAILDAPIDCLLLDSIGELQNWYAAATVVFVGKSMTAHGGQNPVEPIVAGVPVVFGSHMENFATLAKKLVAKNGAIQVADVGALKQALTKLLRDHQARRRLVENAEQVLLEHRGAAARAAKLILDLRLQRKDQKE
jgi:3-deoxy-D-manno-octulosonic-acid transferase